MKNVRRNLLMALAMLSLASPMLLAARTPWIEKVPPHEHDRANIMASDPDAAAAGRLLFEDHCARCHGEQGEGRGKRPSLRSERIQETATPGDLHWFLRNGSLGRGMPSWSKLPDQQLWQIITYLKTLKTEAR